MTDALIALLDKNKIKFEYWDCNNHTWLLLFDDTNDLVLSCRYEGKNYIISDNCTTSIYLNIHFELELSTPEEVINEYYKLLL